MKLTIANIIGNREEFSVQHRVFNVILFSGIILTMVTGTANFIIGLKPFTYLFPFVSFFLFIGLFLFSLSNKNLLLISRVSFTYLLFIFYPVSWFINAGSLGGFQYFWPFFFIILLTTMPKKKGIFVVLFFITVIAVIVLEYFHPELSIGYITRNDRYIDVIITHVLLYLAILAVINIFLKLYQEANLTLKKQKEEIQIAGKKLEIANQNLQEINKTKDKFFSIIAHDLKSPFGSMLGFSNLLNKDYNELNKDEQKKYIGIIHENIENTYKLLENLLVWSRSQRGSIEFRPENENLFLLSKEIIDLIKLTADRKSIKIITDISRDITIYCDKYMFATILQNLLINAVKFTPKNGEVIVKAEQKEKGLIQMSVKDNGVGISKEIQSRLFDISQNISTKGTENESGTGLGLFLCKEFVEKHGGEISVLSEPGKGSEFIFTIPEKSNL